MAHTEGALGDAQRSCAAAGPACAQLPQLKCVAHNSLEYVAQGNTSGYFDRQAATLCRPWSFKTGDSLTTVTFNRAVDGGAVQHSTFKGVFYHGDGRETRAYFLHGGVRPAETISSETLLAFVMLRDRKEFLSICVQFRKACAYIASVKPQLFNPLA